MRDDDRSRTTKDILDALDEAREALREYYYDLHIAVNVHNQDPNQTPEVQESHVVLHVATMRAFDRLRPLVKKHLDPTYWKGSVVYDHQDKYIQGLKSLELFNGQVYSVERSVQRKHGGRETVRDWESQLLPPDACSRTIELLGECCVHLGHIEAPDPPPTVHVLDSQGGDGDWAAENDYEDIVEREQDTEASVRVREGAD